VELRESEGSWVEVLDMEDEPVTYKDGETVKPVRILVAGTYSKQYREITDKQRNRMLKQKRNKLTGAQLRENAKEVAAHCCINWEGFNNKGAPFPCNVTNALALFTAAPHFQEQVEAQMLDHASFFRKPSSN
jgi:hypothetical protein